MFKSKQLPTVTLATVTGVKIPEAIYALWKTSRKLKFDSILLITDREVNNCPPWLKVISLDSYKLDSIDAYSYFCVYELHKYINTSHLLLIQADGYVLRPKLWQDAFLKYDYIGAPWPVVENSYIDPEGKHQRVGNGGFSLRSQRLLTVPNNSEVIWDINSGNYYQHMGYGLQSEDGIICIHNRSVYEELGCKFAPIEVAAKFSTETIVPETVKSLGFHKNIPGILMRINDFLSRQVFRIMNSRKKDYPWI